MSHSSRPTTPFTLDINNFTSPRITTTTLVGPPVSNLSKQLRANSNQAAINSPKLSPVPISIDTIIPGPFGYSTNPIPGSTSSSSSPSTPELSPCSPLAAERNMYASAMNNQYRHQIQHQHQQHQHHQHQQHWDSSEYSNPPSPLSLPPSVDRMAMNHRHHQLHAQQLLMPIPVHPHPHPHPHTNSNSNSNSISPSASTSLSTSLSTTDTPPAAQKKIPRPPNAFMLFRSYFLKSGQIPPSAERKQQTLSTLIGEVWNMMGPEERKEWHDKAAQVLAEHTRRNPNYKFNPSPKGTKKRGGVGAGGGGAGAGGGGAGAGGAGRDKDREEASVKAERVRELREKYTNYHGPSPVSSRKRKVKKAHCVDDAGANSNSKGASKRSKSYDGEGLGGVGMGMGMGGVGMGMGMSGMGMGGVGMGLGMGGMGGMGLYGQPINGGVTFGGYNMVMGGQLHSHAYHPVHPSPLRNTAAGPRRPSTSMGFSDNSKHGTGGAMTFPMPDTRDMRISAARGAGGQPMHGMIHDTTFPNRLQHPSDYLAGIFPFGLPVTTNMHQVHNLGSSISEPSTSPGSRYTHIYDPENLNSNAFVGGLTVKDDMNRVSNGGGSNGGGANGGGGTSNSNDNGAGNGDGTNVNGKTTSPSSPSGQSGSTSPLNSTLDFSKFNYNGQSYNLTKAIIPPSSTSPIHASSTSPLHASSHSPIHASSHSPIHPTSHSPIHPTSHSPTSFSHSRSSNSASPKSPTSPTSRAPSSPTAGRIRVVPTSTAATLSTSTSPSTRNTGTSNANGGSGSSSTGSSASASASSSGLGDTLTIDIEYPASMSAQLSAHVTARHGRGHASSKDLAGGHSGRSNSALNSSGNAGVSCDSNSNSNSSSSTANATNSNTNVNSGWIYSAMEVEMNHFGHGGAGAGAWAGYFDGDDEGLVNVGMGTMGPGV